MGALVPYTFEGRELRALSIDGEPWFVTGDAAAFLAHRDAANLSRGLADDEKGTHRVSTLGGEQEVSIISEAGLYRAMAQRRATTAIPAETREFIARFQRWLFHDVLPTIRRTGSYAPTQPPAAPSDAITREARLLHKHALSIGRLAGLKGNQLLIAANRVTKRGTGFDMLGSMGIDHLIAPVNDPLVIPTKLGQDLGGVAAAIVNRMLRKMGLQIAERDHKQRLIWRPTPKGEALGARMVDVERNNDTGAAQQLKWPLAATLDLLRAYQRVESAGDASGEAA